MYFVMPGSRNGLKTYTVEYGRDNNPVRGYVVGRLDSNGHRFIANHADEKTLSELCSQEAEQIGKRGRVTTLEDGRNIFTLVDGSAKL